MFNLSSIPTDSLYKFLFVGGIVLLIASFYFVDKRHEALYNNKDIRIKDSLTKEHNVIYTDQQITIRFLTHMNHSLNNGKFQEYHLFGKIYNLCSDLAVADTSLSKDWQVLIDCKKHNFQDTFVNARLPQLKRLIKNLIIEQEFYYDDVTSAVVKQLDRYATLVENDPEELKIYKYYIYTFAITGSILTIFGAILWYFITQRVQDSILNLQKETLEKELTQKNNVQS